MQEFWDEVNSGNSFLFVNSSRKLIQDDLF